MHSLSRNGVGFRGNLNENSTLNDSQEINFFNTSSLKDIVQLLEQLSLKFSMYNDNEKKLLDKLLLDGISVAEYGQCATNNYSSFDKLHAEYKLILSSCKIQLNAFPNSRSPLQTNTTSDSNSNVSEYATQVQRSEDIAFNISLFIFLYLTVIST